MKSRVHVQRSVKIAGVSSGPRGLKLDRSSLGKPSRHTQEMFGAGQWRQQGLEGSTELEGMVEWNPAQSSSMLLQMRMDSLFLMELTWVLNPERSIMFSKNWKSA